MRIRNLRAGGDHPLHHRWIVRQHHVAPHLTKPPDKILPVRLAHDQGVQSGHAIRVGFIRGVSRFPQIQQPRVVRCSDHHAGALVTQLLQVMQRGQHRAVVIRTHRMQPGLLNHVVRINPREMRPVQPREIGLIQHRQKKNPPYAPRLQQGVEPFKRDIAGPDHKHLRPESQFLRTPDRTLRDFTMITRRPRITALGTVEIDHGQFTAKRPGPRVPHRRHQSAGQRIPLITVRLGRRHHPRACLRIHPRKPAQGFRNRGLRKPQLLGEFADRGRRHGVDL